MNVAVKNLLIVSLLIGGGAALANYLGAHRPLQLVLQEDPRNSGVSAIAHYKYFVVPSELVFDLRDVSADRSPIDVFRVLGQFARSKRESEYTKVDLSFRGEIRFSLRGSYFKSLGDEFGLQNPIFTLRTFPQNVYLPSGEPAFGTWTGGWLGVIAKQTKDFQRFHEQWYLDELVRPRSPKGVEFNDSEAF